MNLTLYLPTIIHFDNIPKSGAVTPNVNLETSIAITRAWNRPTPLLIISTQTLAVIIVNKEELE